MAKLNTTTFNEGGNDTAISISDHASNPSPTAGKLYANSTSIYWEDNDLTGGGGESVTKKKSIQIANTTGLVDITESGCTAVPLVIISETTLDGTYYTKHTITGTSQFGGVLINSDASNTSTSFSDSSISGHTITVGGHVNHRTNVGTPYSFPKVTAETSIYFDGTGDYLQLPVAHDLKLQNDDFTIETFVYLPSVASSVENIIANWEGSGGTDRAFVLQKETTGAVSFTANHTGDTTLFSVTSGTLLSATTWHHLAATRQGDKLRLFIDGVLEGEDTASSTNQINDSTNSVLIGSGWASGASSVEGSYTGYMDGIRIVKGYAAYTTDFTPPIRPYTNHEFPFSIDTKYKYCGQGTNKTSSDVGATIRMGNDSTGSGAAKISVGECFNVNSTSYAIPILFENSAQGHNHIQYNVWNEAWGNTEFKSSNFVTFGNLHYGTRGVVAGGFESDVVDTMEYFTISSTGNATDFGNLSAARYGVEGVSNVSRGLFAGGVTPTAFFNTMEYITVGSTGEATDFGDLTTTLNGPAGASNGYRALFAGGQDTQGSSQVVDISNYAEIATTGNAIEYGSLTQARGSFQAVSNNSRGVFIAGYTNDVVTAGTYENTIDYYTISSSANATDFGDTLADKYSVIAADDSSRAVFGGGRINDNSNVDNMEYFSIGTISNAVEWGGELTQARRDGAGASNGPRGIFAGGFATAASDTVDYVTIGVAGMDAIDFGNLSAGRWGVAALSGT